MDDIQIRVTKRGGRIDLSDIEFISAAGTVTAKEIIDDAKKLTAELEALRAKAAKWDALDEPKECIRPDRHEGPCNGFPRFICCKNPDCPIDCPDSHCIGGFNPYEDADNAAMRESDQKTVAKTVAKDDDTKGFEGVNQ